MTHGQVAGRLDMSNRSQVTYQYEQYVQLSGFSSVILKQSIIFFNSLKKMLKIVTQGVQGRALRVLDLK